LNKWIDGFQSGYNPFVEKKRLLNLKIIKAEFSCCPFRILITTLTELSQKCVLGMSILFVFFPPQIYETVRKETELFKQRANRHRERTYRQVLATNNHFFLFRY
jgi:hypothetical protein